MLKNKDNLVNVDGLHKYHTGLMTNHIDTINSQLDAIANVSTDDLQSSLNNSINKKLKLKPKNITFTNIKYIGTDVESLEITGSLSHTITSNLNDTSSEKAIIYLANLKTIKIDNLVACWGGSLNLKNKQSVLKIENCENVIITDCELYSGNKNGLEIVNCKNVYINGGKYHKNYHCGIEYANVEYLTVDGSTLIENGLNGDFSDGYGIAQSTSIVPSREVIITNCKIDKNARKGIDCHEFEKIILTNNIIKRSGISGIACQCDLFNADSILISSNIISEQVATNYASESAISVDTTSTTTINNVSISNNIIRDIVGYGVVVKGNNSKLISINNNQILNNNNGYVNGQVIRIIDSVIMPENVVISNNNMQGGNGKGVIIDSAKHLSVFGNTIIRQGSSLLLHFPNKLGDNTKVINAKIEGNLMRGASDYFTNGWTLTGTDGVITDNRADSYIYKNNTIINNKANTSFPLWELNKGLKTFNGVQLTASVGSTGTWVVGDKFEDTTNIFTNGYIGKVWNGSVWKKYGQIEP